MRTSGKMLAATRKSKVRGLMYLLGTTPLKRKLFLNLFVSLVSRQFIFCSRPLVDILARDSFKKSCHLRNGRDELYCVWCKRRGRRGGLLVSALDSGSSGPGSSPGWGHCVVFGQDTTQCLTVPLSTQVYKWVPGNLMLGGTL